MNNRNYVKIGVAGPVGSGKTALLERLSRRLMNDYSIGVIPTTFIPEKMRNS
jgi:urease accessory protein